MIEALKNLGRIIIQKEFNLQFEDFEEEIWADTSKLSYLISEQAFNYDYFENQVENVLEKPHILYINIISKKNGHKFSEISLHQASIYKNDSWVKKEAIGGKFFTPTIPLEAKSTLKSMEKTADKSFTNLIKSLKLNANKKNDQIYSESLRLFLGEIVAILQEKKAEIIQKIAEKILQFFFEVDDPVAASKVRALLTLKVDGKTISEHLLLSEFIIHAFIVKILKVDKCFKNGKIIWTNPKEKMYCSVCQESGNFISTEYKPYTFYTKDKTGYVTQAFLNKNSGHMFPIDLKCALLIEIGRCYVDKYYEFRLNRDNFKLIPKILFPLELKEEKSILSLKNTYKELIQTQSIKSNDRIAQEKSFLFALMDFKNTINFDMIFYEKDQAEFKILLHIKDVAPSRIKIIYDAFEAVRKFISTSPRNYPKLLSFYSIKRLFSRKTGNDFEYDMPSYYKMLESIFSGIDINKNNLLTEFYSNLPSKMYQGGKSPTNNFESEAKSFLSILLLLESLQILIW